MPNLNTGILSAIPLVVPPDDLLWAFARLAEPIEQSISARNAECHSLASLRDALLPKLISGEISARASVEKD
jgi:type I restriction enzyme S subunit